MLLLMLLLLLLLSLLLINMLTLYNQLHDTIDCVEIFLVSAFYLFAIIIYLVEKKSKV